MQFDHPTKKCRTTPTPTASSSAVPAIHVHFGHDFPLNELAGQRWLTARKRGRTITRQVDYSCQELCPKRLKWGISLYGDAQIADPDAQIVNKVPHEHDDFYENDGPDDILATCGVYGSHEDEEEVNEGVAGKWT